MIGTSAFYMDQCHGICANTKYNYCCCCCWCPQELTLTCDTFLVLHPRSMEPETIDSATLRILHRNLSSDFSVMRVHSALSLTDWLTESCPESCPNDSGLFNCRYKIYLSLLSTLNYYYINWSTDRCGGGVDRSNVANVPNNRSVSDSLASR